MAISVRGYTRHVGGKTVTVRGYEQGMHGGQVVRETPHTPTRARSIAAISGTYRVHGSSARFAEGLAPHARFPANRKAPSIVWTRSQLPENPLTLSANSEWASAVQDAFDHIQLVLHNNPTKTLADILPRPDVQEALDTAGQEGASAVIDEVNKIWTDADAPEDSPYLSQIINTLTSNGNSFATRMTIALQDAEPSQALTILNKDRLRAVAAESVARTRARNEHAMSVMSKAGVTHVKWQARTIPGTNEFQANVCSTCRALHNTVINLGASFDAQILRQHGLKPYGTLSCPPAHPNCQCRLVPAKG